MAFGFLDTLHQRIQFFAVDVGIRVSLIKLRGLLQVLSMIHIIGSTQIKPLFVPNIELDDIQSDL